MNGCVEKDLPEALSVLKDIKKSSRECLQNIRAVIAKMKNGPSTKQGISFLDVKNGLMSSYMANLGLLMDKKTRGLSVQDDPAVDRLVEIRTVLEKMRPIEHKMRYQINKVISAYKEGQLDPSDPRKFKANFSAFSNMSDENSSGEETEKAGDSEKPKLYSAPKLAPVHYSDDETTEERQKKQKEKATKRALSSSMLKEMREQYTDAPVEITESSDLHRIRDNKRNRMRTEYEEDNFMRLAVSKKESAGMRKLGTMSALGAIADFGDWDGSMGAEGEPAKKKKKGGILSKKKKKGKGGFGKKGGKRFKR